MSARGRWLAVALVVCLLVPAPAAAAVRGAPDLTVGLAEDTLRAGEEATLQVTVANEARLTQASTTNPSLNERVTTARGVEVEVQSDGPVDVETGSHLLGSLPDGTSATLPVAVSVDDDARPGTYDVPVEIRYTYTAQISEETGATSTRTRTVTETLEVRVEEAARFRVVETSADVRAGESGSVDVTLRNVGSAPARDAQFTLASPDPSVTVGQAGSATRFEGSWAPGETRTLTYGLEAASDVRSGSYTLELLPTFREADGSTVTQSSLLVGVTPGTDRPFAVVGGESTAVEGGSGTVTLTLRNTGDRTLTESSVTLTSETASLAVDGGQSATRYVGSWAPGETRTLTYDLAAGPGTTTGSYALSTTVSYANGDQRVTTRPTPVGVTLADALEFDVADLESELHVGEEGHVEGTLVNRGDRVAHDAVVVLESRSPSVSVPEAVVSVGDVGPGESVPFAFETNVAPAASAGDRPFALTVEYETDDGTARTSEAVTFRRSVGPDREPLRVEPLNATFAPDSSNRLVVRVTNTGETARENVSLQMAAQPPFTSVAPGAYVDRLEPGASTEVGFELTVDEDAVESTHAVSLAVTSEAAGSDRTALDDYRLPVTVASEESAVDATSAVAAVVLAVAIAAGVGYWWYRRR